MQNPGFDASSSKGIPDGETRGLKHASLADMIREDKPNRQALDFPLFGPWPAVSV
jgi:hypothetical protein